MKILYKEESINVKVVSYEDLKNNCDLICSKDNIPLRNRFFKFECARNEFLNMKKLMIDILKNEVTCIIKEEKQYLLEESEFTKAYLPAIGLLEFIQI